MAKEKKQPLSKLSHWTDRALQSARQQAGALLRRQSVAAEGANAMTMPLPAEADRAFKLSGILALGCILLVVLFGTILGAKLYSVLGMGANRYKNTPLVYLDSTAALHYMNPLLEEPVTVVEQLRFDTPGYELESNTQLSENGKQLLFLNDLAQGCGKLYLRNTTRIRPKKRDAQSGGVLVAEQVAPKDFRFVLLDKAVLYLETKQPGSPSQAPRSLYLWQDGKQRLLTTEVMELLGEAKDHKAYYTADVGGVLSLYSVDLSEKGSQPVAIDTDLNGSILKFDPDIGGVVYSKSNGKSPENPHDLYRWDGKTVLQMAEGVGALLDCGPRGEVFYLRMVDEQTDPFQYFEDDRRATDAQMTEPVEKDFMVQTTNLWGGKKTKLDATAYEKAKLDYASKLIRDDIRKAIADQAQTRRMLELMYSTGTSETLIDTGILQVWDTAANGGAAIYIKERVPSSQPHKLSAVVDVHEAVRIIQTVLQNAVQDCYYAKAGSEPVTFLSATHNEQVKVQLDDGRGFYYIKDDMKNEGGILSYVTVQPEGLGVAKKLDDKVLQFADVPYDGQQLYLRSEGETATLCAANGSSKSRLAQGLPQSLSPDIRGKQLLFYQEYNSGRQTGQLNLYDGRIQEVGNQVSAYAYRLPNYIYLLQDYDAGLGTGDLYLYTGNSSKRALVAPNVADIGK